MSRAKLVELQDLPPGALQLVADFGPTFSDRVRLRRLCSATRLVEWRWGPPLSILEDFGGLGLGDVGACAVAEALTRETSGAVIRLRLCDNAIGDRGAAALAGALAASRASVRRLYMEGNEIGPVGARAVSAAIASRETLMEVDLRRNRLGPADKMEIRCSHRGKQVFLDWDLPSPTYMIDAQAHIDARMRCILLDWLMGIFFSDSFDLPWVEDTDVTLFQTISIMDRYLSRKAVEKNRFQLVGATCAFVAARHCEAHGDREPEALGLVKRLVSWSDSAFTEEDLLLTARDVREALEHELDQPTVYTLLLRYLTHTGWKTRKLLLLSEYLLFLTALSYPMLRHRPQVVATAVVALAARTVGDMVDGWQDRLLRIARVTREEAVPCLRAVALLHASAREGVPALKGFREQLSAYLKYSRRDMQDVARLRLAPPCSALLPQ